MRDAEDEPLPELRITPETRYGICPTTGRRADEEDRERVAPVLHPWHAEDDRRRSKNLPPATERPDACQAAVAADPDERLVLRRDQVHLEGSEVVLNTALEDDADALCPVRLSAW